MRSLLFVATAYTKTIECTHTCHHTARAGEIERTRERDRENERERRSRACRTQKASWNPAGVEPVHWKLAHIETGLRVSGAHGEKTLARN